VCVFGRESVIVLLLLLLLCVCVSRHANHVNRSTLRMFVLMWALGFLTLLCYVAGLRASQAPYCCVRCQGSHPVSYPH